MPPSNLGTASLESFIPEPSVKYVASSAGEVGEYIGLLIILSEQSNTTLLRPGIVSSAIKVDMRVALVIIGTWSTANDQHKGIFER